MKILKTESAMLRFAGDWAPQQEKTAPLEIPDLLVLNLEGPVSRGLNDLSARPKAGPHILNFSAPRNTHGGVAVALANNHSMDFGLAGLLETGDVLKETGVLAAFGAGEDSSEAREPLIVETNGTSVGMLSRTEAQFGSATASGPGVADLDARIFADIARLKTHVQYVAILIHGGIEMFPLPSPERRRLWRSLIDAGADLVVGTHSHVPSAWERYNGSLIFYGLGNFCVSPEEWSWHPHGLWSITPQMRFGKEGIDFSLTTSVISVEQNQLFVRSAGPAARAKHTDWLTFLNKIMAEEAFLESLWQSASLMLYGSDYRKWLNLGRLEAVDGFKNLAGNLCARLRKKSRLQIPNKKRQALTRYHLFSTDAHRDAIRTALGIMSGELVDSRTTDSNSLAKVLLSPSPIDEPHGFFHG